MPRGPDDIRSEARRDRDRILYSVAWRRLGGVTQVVTPFEDMALMHNRLTHSEKVAQVARSIADLAGREAVHASDIAEALSLRLEE